MATIAFDLDGTLVDSARDIHAATERLLTEAGCPALSAETIRGFVGNGAPMLVKRVMHASGLPDCEHPLHLRRFMEHYMVAPARHTIPYPGVDAAIDTLASLGHTLTICTNKPAEPAEAVLVALGLWRHFSILIGGDTLDLRKPDTAPLLAALGSAAPGERLFVGDSEIDAETARAAGVPFLLYTEGYRHGSAGDIHCASAFSHFDALPEVVVRALGN